MGLWSCFVIRGMGCDVLLCPGRRLVGEPRGENLVMLTTELRCNVKLMQIRGFSIVIVFIL